MHSFLLVQLNPVAGALALLRPLRNIPGLRHAEVMSGMRLGAPVISPARMQVHRLAVFAEWENEESLERFLAEHPFGRRLATGWHVRLQFQRRWGSVAEFGHLPEIADRSDPNEPIVAVTMARMRLIELPRFIKWGRPVERQVRDDPFTNLALAAARPPRTVSTFSVWQTARAMSDMVHGRAASDDAERHANAMVERERRDFHHEFTTLRFRPLAEFGRWEGRTGIVPRR